MDSRNEKFEYFMERTEKDLSEIKELMLEIKKEVDSLLVIRYMFLGGAAVVSAVVSVITFLISRGV